MYSGDEGLGDSDVGVDVGETGAPPLRTCNTRGWPAATFGVLASLGCSPEVCELLLEVVKRLLSASGPNLRLNSAATGRCDDAICFDRAKHCRRIVLVSRRFAVSNNEVALDCAMTGLC